MFAQGQQEQSYDRAPTKVFTTAELQRVRDEQMRAGIPPGDDAPTMVTSAGALTAAASATAPAAAASPDEKPEWYVAINDDQVGPVTRADLQARWDKGEVKRDTLAWRQGLADWQAVSTISDLSWLTQRPQAVASKPDSMAALAQAATAQGATAAPAEAAKPAEPAKPVVTWRPQGASAASPIWPKVAVEEREERTHRRIHSAISHPPLPPAPTNRSGECRLSTKARRRCGRCRRQHRAVATPIGVLSRSSCSWFCCSPAAALRFTS